MTALEVNTQIWRNIAAIADDEPLMTQLAKYVKKLVAKKKKDSTLMTKEEFFANVDEALLQAKQGRVHRMKDGESLDEFLNRV
ncbi:MAG: hypothetical protein IKP73_19350 [Bacteroidales bacterium]|nr:hypothetical protein [Bacteroidales bacterium]